MVKDTKIPNATIERISIYSRPLEKLLEEKTMVISSERLASLCKVNPAQVRKDLSYFGEFGVRGIGYDVADLLRAIQKILVNGNMGVTTKEILKQSGICSGANIFTADLSSAAENICHIGQIQGATVARILPNKISITVKER